MPRIPTYTAERDLPAGPVAVEASTAAFTAPARALGAVASGVESAGNNVERAIYQVAAAKKEVKERDEAFWAAEQAEGLTREFMDFQNKNAESETAAEDFMRFSKERIDAAASGAPSASAGQRLRRMIGDNVTSNYGRALTVSTAVKEQNRLDSLKGAAQNIAGMINESGGGGYNLAVTQPLIDARIEAINKLPLSDGSKRRLRAAFHEELALAVGPNEPEFALGLIDSTDFDESKKRILRNQIESYSKANNAAAIATFRKGMEFELSTAAAEGIQKAPPTDETLQAIYGDSWEAEKVEIVDRYRVVNTAVGEWNKVRSWSYPNQVAEIRKNVKPGDARVWSILSDKLEQSARQQSGIGVSSWVQNNIKDVSDAYVVAYAAQGADKTAKRMAADAKNLQYQGVPPPGTSAEEAKKYLYHAPGRMHLLTPERAEEWAAQINAMQPASLMDFIASMAQEYPDDQHRAIVWNDLVTMPRHGNQIKPEIQFAMMIPSRQLREQYLGIMQNKAAVQELNPESQAKFRNALDGDSAWMDFAQAIDPNLDSQRSGSLADFRGAVLAYAERKGQIERLSPERAIRKATEDLIRGSWGFTKVNGQVLAVQRLRDDFNQKPIRTDAEVEDIGRKLAMAISVVPLDQVELRNQDGSPVFPKSELIKDNNTKKLAQIQQSIRSSGFWYMNPDGQGAQLYIRDAESGVAFPLRDKSGNPFSVDFDQINQTPMTAIGGGVQQRDPRSVTPDTRIPVKPYPELLVKDGILGDVTTNQPPPIGSFWKNLRRDYKSIKD